MPSVRIPDGNLVRVLTEGLREWVRIGMLRRRYGEVIGRRRALEKKTEFFSRPPGLASLVGALERLKRKKLRLMPMIFHSERR